MGRSEKKTHSGEDDADGKLLGKPSRLSASPTTESNCELTFHFKHGAIDLFLIMVSDTFPGFCS